MAIIVSLLTKDEDRHNLRLVCKHWRCAVNENVTRCEIKSEMSWMSLVKPKCGIHNSAIEETRMHVVYLHDGDPRNACSSV